MIQNMVEILGWKDKSFTVDLDNERGNTIDTLDYEGDVSAKKVVDDIRYYFREGKVPYKSELSDFRYSKKLSFTDQVDNVLAGKQSQTIDLYVAETPSAFIKLGFTKTPMLMRSSKVKDILEKFSEMSEDIIKQIPEDIQNPLLILKYKTNPDESVVAITEVMTMICETTVFCMQTMI